MRKPPTKTAAASRIQAGHTERDGEPRPVTPIHTPRSDDPDERRIEERHRGEDVAVVEVPERRRRREQHHEIEVADRQRPPEVGETDQEDEAEEAPHPRLVDLRAAERARVAARHLPRDLRPGPCVRDDAARVVDVRLDDLPGRAEPDLHAASSPSSGRTSRRRPGPACRIPGEPRGDLRVALGDREHRALVRCAGFGVGANGAWIDARCRRTPAPCRRRRRGASRRRKRQRADRDERGRRTASDYGRRNDHNLFPTKFSGVTSTIAIAWPTSFPAPSVIRTCSTSRFAPSEASDDDEEAHPLRSDSRAAVTEGPVPIERVVARDGDEEGARRGQQIVQADVQQHGVDGEIDAVADCADDAELRRAAPSAGACAERYGRGCGP